MPKSAAPLRIPPPPIAGARYWLGYSGGVDSTVLLHALKAELAAPASLQAVHVHHDLQATADDWARRCERQAREWGLSFTLCRIQVSSARGQGPEAAARSARYAALQALMQPGDVLVTAHHQDDQAETFLLQALRGGGAQGLGSMRRWQAFGPGWLWRPLLDASRAQIEAYARQQGLSWIDDPHNADLRYTRSRLRREVMPQLARCLPGAAAALAQSAALCAEAAALNDLLAEQDFAGAERGRWLSIESLHQLDALRRRNLLRWWLTARCSLPLPPRQVWPVIDAELLDAAADAEPRVAWPGAELRRYRGLLFAMPPLPPEPPEHAVLHWQDGSRLMLPAGCGLLDAGTLPPGPLRVRFGAPGVRFRQRGAAHRRTLKNLFQERGIPPWERRRTPLVYLDADLCWIGQLGAAEPSHSWFDSLSWRKDGWMG